MSSFQSWVYIKVITSKFGKLWSPGRQQIWPWKGQRSQHGANWKGLSQGSCIPNINALSLILQKIWARLKFLWQREGRTNKWVLMSPAFAKACGTIKRLQCISHHTYMSSSQSCAYMASCSRLSFSISSFILSCSSRSTHTSSCWRFDNVDRNSSHWFLQNNSSQKMC